MAKKYVTWEQVEKYVHEVASQCWAKQITGVYGLPRGGLVLAVMLSHKLHVPMLAAPSGGHCLIVDDICDSGESLLHYAKNSSSEDHSDRPYITTMYYKENTLDITTDFSLYEKGDDWIVFPWEDKEE